MSIVVVVSVAQLRIESGIVQQSRAESRVVLDSMKKEI